MAIIDSGMDASHPGRRADPGLRDDPRGRASASSVYDTEPHEDSFGHGTACAGIIRSIAPECEIYSVKVLGAGLSGSGTVFAAACSGRSTTACRSAT